MFITKKQLSRRTVLQGMGAALALPLLDAMVPALTPVVHTAASPTRRLGVVFFPLGWRQGFWVPSTAGADFEYTPILKPLEGLREHVTLVTQLDNPLDGHAATVSPWLSGALPKKTFAEDVYSGQTVDQVVARKIGQETLLPSLQLAVEDPNSSSSNCGEGYSCAYTNSISWIDVPTPAMESVQRTSPIPMELNPAVVFERLFGSGATAEERMARMRCC